MTQTLPPVSFLGGNACKRAGDAGPRFEHQGEHQGEFRQEAFQPAGAQRPPAALPCQKGNNSNDDDLLKALLDAWEPKQKRVGKEVAKGVDQEVDQVEQVGVDQRWRLVTPYHAKAAFALSLEVKAMCDRNGIDQIGFLTLTFKDHVLDLREAQRRYNSLATGVLRERYAEFITVAERQSSGRVHYHLIVVLRKGIRQGFDFTGVKLRDYTSANPFLRDEWAFWRKTAPAYGFGRTELLPIKTTVKAMAGYVGKYIGKHIGMRRERDKGCRLVRCSVESRKASVRFMWNSPRARLWRSQLAAFAASRGIERYEQLAERLGNSWAWFFGERIMAFENPESTPSSTEVESNKVVPAPTSSENFQEKATVDGEGAQSLQDGVGEAASVPAVQYVYDVRGSVYRPARPEGFLPVLSATLKARLREAGIDPDG